MASPNTKRNNAEQIEKNELYSTPTIALETFYEQFPEVFDRYKVYYDPCDGMGQISDFLESKGKKVYRGDIVNYKDNLDYEGDFLKCTVLPEDVECVVMNPPFTLTGEFVDKALSLCPNLLMFNRLTTIESKSRAEKFKSKDWNLKTMYQFGFRVSCPKGVDFETTANSVAYSWFEFEKHNRYPTTLEWII